MTSTTTKSTPETTRIIVVVSIEFPLFKGFGSDSLVASRAVDYSAHLTNAELLDLSAAALDQNDQHDNKKHPGCDADDCRCVHSDSPFF